MIRWHKVFVSTVIVTIVALSVAGVANQETTLPNSPVDQPRKVEKAVKSASHAHRSVFINVTATRVNTLTATDIYWNLIKGILAGLAQGLISPRRQRITDHRATQKALNTLRKASELAAAISNEDNKWIKRPGTSISQILAELTGKVTLGAETLRVATRQLSTRSVSSHVTSAGGTKLEQELATSNGNGNSTNDKTAEEELQLYLSNLFL